MMIANIIKGFLVGICASAPIGPIAIFVIQKTLSEGQKAGFITAMGSTLMDVIYSIIAMFALALAESFLNAHRTVILIVGGIVVAILGWSMTFSDPFRKMEANDPTSSFIKDFIKAVIMGITNPGAILIIFSLFAFFGIEVETNNFEVMPVILAVGAGSAVFWFLLTWGLGNLRKNFKLGTLLWINRISGIIVMIIGLALFAEGMLKAIFL